MSISISWRIVRSDGHPVHGTSNDWSTYERIFGRRHLTAKDCDKLYAMHEATGLAQSLWGDLWKALVDLPDDTEIEVNAAW